MRSRSVTPVLALVWCLATCGQTNADMKSTDVPRYDTAVQTAITHLSQRTDLDKRDISLVAYALLKAGADKSEPHLVAGLQTAQERAALGTFNQYQGSYIAAVDAMLLADAAPPGFVTSLQKIADRILSFQKPDGSWRSPGDKVGDVSLMQYCALGLWAAHRAGCEIDIATFDRTASYLLKNVSSDGGWAYRPRTTVGPEKGLSSHNMTLAAVGTLSICRLILFPKLKTTKESDAPARKFGVLEQVTDDAPTPENNNAKYTPRTSRDGIARAIARGLGWNRARFSPVPHTEFQLYFYYTLERAAALADFREDWYTIYGDGLLTLQHNDGSFQTKHKSVGSAAATSFAILYYMRSTQQILDKQYGAGMLAGGRGLDNLFGTKKERQRSLSPLDELLRQMESADLTQLDAPNTADLVESITFGSREQLIGQVDLLKKLLKHPDASNRQAAYYGLGRTGNFLLIPEMLKGLRDPSLDVNTEALMALRYISRKPNGFNLPLRPATIGQATTEKQKVLIANVWRNQLYKRWATWYSNVRPYDERGGLDEVELQKASE